MRWRQQHVVRKVEVWVGVKSVRESVCMHVCVCVLLIRNVRSVGVQSEQRCLQEQINIFG